MRALNPEQILIGKEKRQGKHKRPAERGNPVRVFKNERPKLSLVEESDSVKALKSHREKIENKIRTFEVENEIDERYRGLIKKTMSRYEEKERQKAKEYERAQEMHYGKQTPPGERQASAIRRDQERKAA